MYTLVIYDITDDDIRLKVAELCKEFGLTRIQKSAFLGKINSQKRKELKHKLQKILENRLGNIQIFQICEADLKFREVLGNPIGYEDEGLIFL